MSNFFATPQKSHFYFDFHLSLHRLAIQGRWLPCLARFQEVSYNVPLSPCPWEEATRRYSSFSKIFIAFLKIFGLSKEVFINKTSHVSVHWQDKRGQCFPTRQAATILVFSKEETETFEKWKHSRKVEVTFAMSDHLFRKFST